MADEAAALERRQAVAAGLDQFRLLFDHALDAVLLTAPDGRIIAANPAAQRTYGMTEAEIVAAGRAELVDAADARLSAFLEERRRSGAARGEFRSKRGDGRTFPSEVASAVFRGADGAEYAGTFVRDLTEQKRIEAEREELARAKDELVAVVSHELRTPLASLVGFAELLLVREFPEAERREFLRIMLQEGQRLTALINDFLDLQRMESGRQEIRPVPIDVGPLLERATAAAGDDTVRPIVIEAPDGLAPIAADPDRIHQVLMNLLSNARKYSPHGGEIRLSARIEGGVVEVSVTDRGLGVPAEALPQLFGKFYRVDNSDRRDITGTGLGLAICQKIVAAHGGRIWAESAGLGAGTTVRFTLPLAEDGPTTGDVLVVEDDPGFARLLAEELGQRGLTAVRVPSAETALARLRAAPFRAILLDLILPVLPGEAFLPRLRELAGPPVPVVVVTVKDLDPEERAALDHAGAGAILRKGPGVAADASEAVPAMLAPAPPGSEGAV